MSRKVHRSPEFSRIKYLPTRKDTAPLTDLSTSNGTMSLFPAQDLALRELRDKRGLVAPVPVGGGKTLISLLSATVVQAKRPLLLLPANLISKTERERRVLSEHWKIPAFLRIYSYEMLSRVAGANMLEFHRPDLLICDEAHNLKNLKAACTRRVARYMDKYEDTMFVALSGTFMKNSLKDFSHLAYWALRRESPVPFDPNTLNAWCYALDQNMKEFQRSEPGAILEFCLPEDLELPPLDAARKGYSRRIMSTPGVVGITPLDKGCQASIKITGHLYPMNPETDLHFNKLRKTWTLPTGEELSEAVELWRHARELALGLHYRWDPPGPPAWLMARSSWSKHVREIISRSHELDSELAVALKCQEGLLDPTLYLHWTKIKPSFTPNPIPVWHDEKALEFCAGWAKKGSGIIWTQHIFFGEALAKKTGLPYYREGGKDQLGNSIEDADGVVIASIDSNKEGRNLQKWNRNLVASMSGGAVPWEQLIGRTHRPGQGEDTVYVDLMVGCVEDLNDWNKALDEARAIRDLLGQDQKILQADVDMPEKALGPRWS